MTVHIQSQAAVNCNHSNYLQYIFLRTQVVKDFFKRKYILAVPWVHFPDGLLLLLHDLVSAFIPQPESLTGVSLDVTSHAGPCGFSGCADAAHGWKIGLRVPGVRILAAFRFN